MSSKLISIIIPVFNRADLISETLNSIIAQTYVNWECIIVDDGSTDESREVVLSYVQVDNRFTLYERPSSKLKGPSSCRNYGFDHSKGDYIQFFDSDDIMHPDHLQYKIEKINTADFVVCQLKEFHVQFDYNFNSSIKDEKKLFTDSIFEDFVTENFPMMMVMPMWKKSSLAPYMPIREDMNILEDYELFTRALCKEKKFVILDKTLIFYRVGLSSLVNSFLTDIEFGIDSYLSAKKTVLGLPHSNKIKFQILKSTVHLLRLGMVQKKYQGCALCLDFIKAEKLCYSFPLKLKLIRITFFYTIFKVLGKGETRFKRLVRFDY